MGFDEDIRYIKDGFNIFRLDQKIIAKVSRDKAAFGYGALIVALAGAAFAAGTLNLAGLVIFPILYVIASFIGLGITHLLAKIFGGKASYSEFYRPASVSYSALLIVAIPFIGPFLGFLVSLWLNFVVTTNILKAVHKISTLRAVIVVLIPLILVAILLLVLVIFAVAFLAAFFTGMGIAGNPELAGLISE